MVRSMILLLDWTSARDFGGEAQNLPLIHMEWSHAEDRNGPSN